MFHNKIDMLVLLSSIFLLFSCAGEKSTDSSASSNDFEHHSSPADDWPKIEFSGDGKEDVLLEKETIRDFVDDQLALALNIAEESAMIIGKDKLGPDVTGIKSIQFSLSKKEHFKFDNPN